MGFRIQNNIAALNAHRNLQISDSQMSKSLERLSSGFRINSAKDDAAGLAISQSFRADIAAVKVAQRNISEANALLQTAEGAMNSIGDILTRMKELATQAASANAGNNRDKISDEYNTLVLEIDRIVGSTKYAGDMLLDGTFGSGNTATQWDEIDNVYDVDFTGAATGAYAVTYATTTNVLSIQKGTITETATLTDDAQTVTFETLGITFKKNDAGEADTVGAALAAADPTVTAGTAQAFQIGYDEDTDSKISVSISAITASGLGLAADDISTATKAYNILSDLDDAIGTLADSRGSIGAYQNRLSYGSANLSITLENFTAAESVIRDVDMAAEMTSFTKSQILIQAGTSMLAQANMSPQQVLSLFQ